MVTDLKSLAAETWQRGVYRRVNKRMKLSTEEFEKDMDYLRSAVEGLRNLRKQLLAEKHD